MLCVSSPIMASSSMSYPAKRRRDVHPDNEMVENDDSASAEASDVEIPPLPVEFLKLSDDLIALGQKLQQSPSTAEIVAVAEQAEKLCVAFWENWWSK